MGGRRGWHGINMEPSGRPYPQCDKEEGKVVFSVSMVVLAFEEWTGLKPFSFNIECLWHARWNSALYVYYSDFIVVLRGRY